MSSTTLLGARFFIKVGLFVLLYVSGGLVGTDAQITFDLDPPQPENNLCTSPDGLEGECINILQCRPVLQLLRRHVQCFGF